MSATAELERRQAQPKAAPLAPPPLWFYLQPKQAAAFLSPATELLYGGAAFGGKSHLVRVALIFWCMLIPGLQCYVFRRVMDDLVRNHMDGPKGFRNMLQPLVSLKMCHIIEDQIRFWNGSKIWLCHCASEKDRFKYHGAEIHVLVIDELTTFSEVIYRYLRFRVRMVGLTLPESIEIPTKPGERPIRITLKGLFPRILCCTNPGNVGHSWVKRTWISPRKPLQLEWMPPEEGGMLRQYIPARYEDNEIGMSDDPTAVARMEGLGSKELVRAMKEGDWEIIAGAFFEEFNAGLHVLKDFTPPVKATRFRAIDWGSARPFSVGWYAICDGTWPPVETADGRIIRLPKDALVRYREWYGQRDGEGQDNVGIKLTTQAFAAGILSRSAGEQYAYTTCDPSMWEEKGGPSIAEVMGKNGVKRMRKADNARVTGWQQVHYRLKGDANDDNTWPLLYFMESGRHLIRTLPVLRHDESGTRGAKLEDVDTRMEDHAPDEVRYACMSRPRQIIPRAPDRATEKPKAGTFDALTQSDRKPTSKYRMTG